MQDGRVSSPVPRGSLIGQPGAEGASPVSQATGILRTNAVLYSGPVAPDRRKLNSSLVGGAPQCPDQQPRAPFSPPGVAVTDTWRPFYVVPLPPKLVFETWWHEGPSNRVNMHVTFDTATRRCLAGTYVSLAMEVTTATGAPVDEYDLHVGAELRVAGRKVTLRKAVTLATLTWLDQQARAMLVTKYRLEQELLKFRPVVPVPVQYTESRRAELFDLSTHQHLPAGGRINLRSLYNFILDLIEQLRQHRPKLPPLPEAVAERLTAAADTLPAPPDWSPERREFDRREAEARQRVTVESEPSDDDTWRNDLTNWLDSIPLAASCCTRYQPGKASGVTGPGLLGAGPSGEVRAGGGGGGGKDRDREKAGRAGPGGGLGRPGGGHLAFNISVINRIGGAHHLGGGGHHGPGGGSSAAISRMQSMAAGSPLGNRTFGRSALGPHYEAAGSPKARHR